MRTKQQQLRQLLADRVLTARDLMRELEISQPTLSRLIAGMQQEIVVMGKGRATCYGLPRHSDQEQNQNPVYSIDSKGDIHLHGHMTSLRSGQYWWQPPALPGELFNQLPWFLQDLLLSGYSARAFALRHSEHLHLSRRWSDWTEEDMLFATSRCGEDRPGNLLLGKGSLTRYFATTRKPPEVVESDPRNLEYPRLAQKTLSGAISPAQVGGEQPKFSVCVNEQGTLCRMLVKFSPAVDSKEAQRYADLLVCEHLALEAIRLAGHAAARSRVVIAGNQTFLCLKRFDRRGAFGRLPVISLRALHARIHAPCDHWIQAANRLLQQGLIRPEEAAKLHWLSLFSDMTGNTNQHFGNISFIPHGRNSYFLAPAYGIRPTLYEPMAGEIPSRLFTPPPIRNEAAPELSSARRAAIFFWKSAAVDERISEDFRQICYENCEMLQLLNNGPKLVG